MVNFGQGFGDLCVGSRQLFLRPIVLLTALSRGPEQLLCPIEVDLCQRQRGLALIESGDPSMQKSYLVVDVLHGVLQFPAPAPGFCFNTARHGFGRLQVCVCGVDGRSLLGDRDLIRLLVQFGEKLSFVHTVIVIHQNPGNLAADAGSNERHMPVDVCVIRRDGVEHLPDPGNAQYADGCQNQGAEHAHQQLSPPRRLTIRRWDDLRRFGFVLNRNAFAGRARLDPTRLLPFTSCFSVISTGMASNPASEPNPPIPGGLRCDDRPLMGLRQMVRRAPEGCKIQPRAPGAGRKRQILSH